MDTFVIKVREEVIDIILSSIGLAHEIKNWLVSTKLGSLGHQYKQVSIKKMRYRNGSIEIQESQTHIPIRRLL